MNSTPFRIPQGLKKIEKDLIWKMKIKNPSPGVILIQEWRRVQ
jgi:hypothetical protein